MTVKELIRDLSQFDPEAKVKLGQNGRHQAIAVHLLGAVRKQDVNCYDELSDECDGTVYLLDDGQIGYLTQRLWD
tara:strand:- start:1030 stop:1254 length:225 start_codon:yes stop_codon:yes gene_type:complete